MELNQSSEDYLEAILILQQKQGEVRSVDIARYMNYAKASITVAMQKLQSAGLISIDDNKHIYLTRRGEEAARNVYGKHEFLKTYFVSIGVDEKTAEDDACLIEHVISDESLERMKATFQGIYIGGGHIP